jgi:DNA adenine methylase
VRFDIKKKFNQLDLAIIVIYDDDCLKLHRVFFMAFPGGKGKSYPHLINLMPPHDLYVDLFLGSAAVVKNKKPSRKTIVNDIDSRCINDFRNHNDVQAFSMDANELLQKLRLTDSSLVYCDPPYVQSVRRKSKIYKDEYSDLQHEVLLDSLLDLDCMVMISGYKNPLYTKKLGRWNMTSFSCQSQCGPREETVWYNFETPTKLHDSRYLGKDFRERQSVKRRMARLKSKFREMEPVERSSIIEWLQQEFPDTGEYL